MCPAFLCNRHGRGAMGPAACGWVAGLIDWIEGRRSDQGGPRCPTEAVVETLRFFVREGVQWRALRATGDRVCAAIARLYADAAYHSAEDRGPCRAEGILPLIRERGAPHG